MAAKSRHTSKPRRRSGGAEKSAPQTTAAPTKGRWTLCTLPPGVARSHALELALPVPSREVQRLHRGSFQYDELARWIEHYLEEVPDADNAPELANLAAFFSEYHRALKALENQALEDAETLLADLSASRPADLQVRLNLAAARVSLGRNDGALEALEGVDENLRDSIRYIVLRSRALSGAGKLDEARKYLLSWYQKAPGSVPLQQELVRMGELIPTFLNPRNLTENRFVPRSVYERSTEGETRKLVEAGKMDRALAFAEMLATGSVPQAGIRSAGVILEKDPNNAPAKLVRGIAKLRAGQEAAEALEDLSAAQAALPEDERAAAALGEALHKSGKTEDARQMLQAFLKSHPESLKVSEAYLLTFAEVDQQIEEAVKIAKDFPDSWVPRKLLADLRFREGRFADALEGHLEAFERSRSDDALTMVLHDYERLGKLEAAVALIQSLPDLNKRTANSRWNAGNVLLRAGRTRPAVEVFEAITKDESLSTETRYAATLLLHDLLASR